MIWWQSIACEKDRPRIRNDGVVGSNPTCGTTTFFHIPECKALAACSVYRLASSVYLFAYRFCDDIRRYR